MEKKNNVIPLNQELEKKFKAIELSLYSIRHKFGPESSDVSIAQDYLNEGDIEGAFYQLHSSISYGYLISEIKELKDHFFNKEKENEEK